MFDGMASDEFQQFIASRASLPIPPLPFPLPGNASFPEDGFNSYSHEFLQLQHPESLNNKNDINVRKELESPLIPSNLVVDESDGSMDPSWSTDEILALLKVRSSMENWSPDLSWEHVSRKLLELGFKRSAVHCKEKFEDESRHFNITLTYNNLKNYRNAIFSEFDAFYPGGKLVDEKNEDGAVEKQIHEEDKMQANIGGLGRDALNPTQQIEEIVKRNNKKRKRKDKFEMFKDFCEAIVGKMISQQEELHNKLIEDMVRRDREMIRREEAWKNQEMDRIKLESETRAEEQASSNERQVTIIEFLKKFTSSEDQNFVNKIEDLVKVMNNSTSNSETSLCNNNFQAQITHHHFPATTQNKSELETSSTSPSCMAASHQNPSSLPREHNQNTTKTPSPSSPSSGTFVTKNSEVNSSLSAQTNKTKNNPSSFVPHLSTNKPFHENLDSRGDTSKRWPRDEVLALINLRCKLSDNIDENKQEGAKGPLWVRISLGMFELGYKRSAKRCKEKWENINKYFRKTKDNNKKRSVDSRTCPYFHQLNFLYSEGTLVAPTNMPENE